MHRRWGGAGVRPAPSPSTDPPRRCPSGQRQGTVRAVDRPRHAVFCTGRAGLDQPGRHGGRRVPTRTGYRTDACGGGRGGSRATRHPALAQHRGPSGCVAGRQASARAGARACVRTGRIVRTNAGTSAGTNAGTNAAQARVCSFSSCHRHSAGQIGAATCSRDCSASGGSGQIPCTASVPSSSCGRHGLRAGDRGHPFASGL